MAQLNKTIADGSPRWWFDIGGLAEKSARSNGALLPIDASLRLLAGDRQIVRGPLAGFNSLILL
jgi:hypothetical protein